MTLRIDGDGMAASLLRVRGAIRVRRRCGRLLAGTPLTVDLPAGLVSVAASSLGRNDRLAYKIALQANELQPDTPRNVTLPVALSFAVARRGW